MIKFFIKNLTLLKSFDAKGWQRIFGKKNEVYFRCVCWLENDFSTVQYYPNPQILSDFLKRDLLLEISKNDPHSFMGANNNTPEFFLFKSDSVDAKKLILDIVKEQKTLTLRKAQLTKLRSRKDVLERGKSEAELAKLKEVHDCKLKINELSNRLTHLVKIIRQDQAKLDYLSTLVPAESEKNPKVPNPPNQDKIKALKLSIIDTEKEIIKNQEVLAKATEEKNIYNNRLQSLEATLKNLGEQQSKVEIEVSDKIDAKILEIDQLEYNLKVYLKKLESYAQTNVVSYIIQILESDQNIRDMGEYLTTFAAGSPSLTTPWIEAENARHAAEMAAMLQAAKEAAGPEGFVTFDPAAHISPTVYPKAAMDFITAGMDMIGKIFLANKDDIIGTFAGTFSSLKQPTELKKQGVMKMEVELELDNTGLSGLTSYFNTQINANGMNSRDFSKFLNVLTSAKNAQIQPLALQGKDRSSLIQ